jgi:hypothetical protein
MTSAPLTVTVEIRVLEGPSAGQRRYRLSRRIQLPPTLSFQADLPLEGQAQGRVTFQLPGAGLEIQARALLRYDPEHPELGSGAELLDLPPEVVQALQTYIENHGRLTP